MAQSQPQAFSYKGIAQKKDPAQLGPGEFYFAENVLSQQEGALTARTGHQELTKDPLPSNIISLSKLNIGNGVDADNPRYLGSGQYIYRDLPPYSGNVPVYSGLGVGQRWSAEQYNAGASGTPSLFLATYGASANFGSGALRDNGSYTTLQDWGVDPPPIPIQATINVPFLSALNVELGADTRFIPNVNSLASGPFTGAKTITAITSAPGYATITPTAASPINGVNGIYVGMLLTITDTNTSTTETIIVLAVDENSCYGITSLTHAIASGVYLSYGQTPYLIPAASAAGSYTITFTGLSIDASFNGVASNGFSTDDPFHIGLLCTDVTTVTKIQIQIVPNFTGTPPASDYYEYDIAPAASMQNGSPLTSASPVLAQTSPAWYEINIPKNAFKAVGNAGAGAFNWSNINQIYIVFNYSKVPASDTYGIVVAVGDAYFTGGGGLNSTASGTSLYDYLYCFQNPTSGAIGNPCPFMATPNIPAAITNGSMTLKINGTFEAATIANGIGEISGPSSIKIYRRGGTFSDGLFRHIGYATNPGTGGFGTNSNIVTFVDNASDESLDTADTLQFDNDPPVPSSLPTPLTANIHSFQPTGGGTDYNTSSQAQGGSASAITTNAVTRVVLSSLPSSFVASAIASTITVGSTIQVGFGPTFETCIITSVGYGTGSDSTSAWFETYLQYNHNITSVDSSETVECDAILRGRCNLIHQDFDCVFLAGDQNNPATLYQSKVGRPEAFPVVNLENNFAQQINVGAPSNPINGITSIGPGELVCLNQNNIFIVEVWGGQMQIPIQAPASRGLYAKFCWCKGDNRIWYLAYDGIYIWSGGESQKVSQQIDYMFKNQTVNGIAPINYSLANLFSFSYAENCLYVVYADTNNLYHRLKYETLYQRWTIETIIDANGDVYAMTALFTEPDTGDFLVAITTATSEAFLWLCDFYSTTDGWVNVITDGFPIRYTAWKYWPIADPTADYQIGEVEIELVNPSDSVAVALFYNYSTTPDPQGIAITAGALTTRGRFFAAINSAESGVVQYSIGIKITGSTGEAALTEFFTFGWRNFEWSDAGYPGPKVFEWLTMQVNTNGVSVPFQLQLDGSVARTFDVSGTFFDRNNTVTLPSNLIGTQYRVVPQAGFSGTLQLYGVQPKFEKQPIPITHFDSLMQVWGAAGWKICYQIWLDFQCSVPIILSIYRDGNVLFFQQTVPANPERAVSRFYLPMVNLPAGGTQYQYNKSQSYQFVIDSQDGTTPLQLYRDGTRAEIRNLSTDQRAGFDQKIVWELIPLES